MVPFLHIVFRSHAMQRLAALYLIVTITSAGFLTGSVYEIDGGSHLLTQ